MADAIRQLHQTVQGFLPQYSSVFQQPTYTIPDEVLEKTSYLFTPALVLATVIALAKRPLPPPFGTREVSRKRVGDDHDADSSSQAIRIQLESDEIRSAIAFVLNYEDLDDFADMVALRLAENVESTYFKYVTRFILLSAFLTD